MKSVRSAARSVLGRVTVMVTVAATLAAACGGGGTDLDLTAAGTQGRDTANNKGGCAACHGRNGEGGVGPAFVGLFESEVPVIDREGNEFAVTADRDYLIQSIMDPGALRVANAGVLNMPENGLTVEQINSIVDYIQELKDVAP